MEPNVFPPPAGGPQPQANPYDYILNPAKPPRKSLIFGNGKPNKIIMIAFVLFVLLVVVIALSVFNSLTSKSYDSVLALAQRQTEIVRVADLGLLKAHDPATLNYVSTVRNVALSEKNDTVAFLMKKGQSVGTAKLSLKKDTSTDRALTAAEQNNTYDTVLTDKINALLDSYHKAENSVTGTGDSNSEKLLFADLLGNAKILTNAK